MQHAIERIKRPGGSQEALDGKKKNAVQSGKCPKCGSKKHETKDCSVDLTKVRCFRCSQYGHVGVNCPDKNGTGVSKGSLKGKGKENTGKDKGVSKGDPWKKGKSNGKGKSTKGKKGKLNETTEEWDPEESWWWNDNDWWGADAWQEFGVAQVWDDSYDWNQSFGSWTQYREDNPQLGLENAPDGNGNEQTVGSLIFAPMLHVMSETNANDCQTCVVCARDVLGSSLFCSTCAGISFEGFDNFNNSDVFGQQSSFEKGLNDNKAFSGLEEFWKFRPGLVGSLSGAEDAAESLVSPACARVQVFKPAVSTFLDLPATDTCSLSQRLSVWSPLVAPLLSQMTYEDASWWLLDSGASATVLAESCMRAFGIDEPLDVGMPNFKTANGGDVGTRGIASPQVSMLVSEKGKQGLPPVWKKGKNACFGWQDSAQHTFNHPFVSVRMVFFANTRQFFFETQRWCDHDGSFVFLWTSMGTLASMEEFGRGLDGPQICSFWFSRGFTTIGIMFVSCFKIRTSGFRNS